jgi:hypothetical protein
MRIVLLSLAAMPCASMLSGCANTVSKATSVGNGNFIMTAHGNPSPFGVSSNVDMGKLIEAGSATCEQKGLHFVLVDRQDNAGNTFKLGDGSITFKCQK